VEPHADGREDGEQDRVGDRETDCLSMMLRLARLDLLDQIIERSIFVEVFADFGVVAGPGGKLLQKPRGIRNAKLSHQEFERCVIQPV
jgi:hypothetical protein